MPHQGPRRQSLAEHESHRVPAAHALPVSRVGRRALRHPRGLHPHVGAQEEPAAKRQRRALPLAAQHDHVRVLRLLPVRQAHGQDREAAGRAETQSGQPQAALLRLRREDERGHLANLLL